MAWFLTFFSVRIPFFLVLWSSAGSVFLQRALLRITHQNRLGLFIWKYRPFYYWTCHQPVLLIMCFCLNEERHSLLIFRIWLPAVELCLDWLSCSIVINYSTDLHLAKPQRSTRVTVRSQCTRLGKNWCSGYHQIHVIQTVWSSLPQGQIRQQ